MSKNFIDFRLLNRDLGTYPSVLDYFFRSWSYRSPLSLPTLSVPDLKSWILFSTKVAQNPLEPSTLNLTHGDKESQVQGTPGNLDSSSFHGLGTSTKKTRYSFNRFSPFDWRKRWFVTEKRSLKHPFITSSTTSFAQVVSVTLDPHKPPRRLYQRLSVSGQYLYGVSGLRIVPLPIGHSPNPPETCTDVKYPVIPSTKIIPCFRTCLPVP